ncbi:MAG: hypothetical protein ACI8YQ_001730 [Polaribacter sp.]|jgi:hypothetical protein
MGFVAKKNYFFCNELLDGEEMRGGRPFYRKRNVEYCLVGYCRTTNKEPIAYENLEKQAIACILGE